MNEIVLPENFPIKLLYKECWPLGMLIGMVETYFFLNPPQSKDEMEKLLIEHFNVYSPISQIVNNIRDKNILLIGYLMPRLADSVPVVIEENLFNNSGAEMDNKKDEIRVSGLHFVGVRFCFVVKKASAEFEEEWGPLAEGEIALSPGFTFEAREPFFINRKAVGRPNQRDETLRLIKQIDGYENMSHRAVHKELKTRFRFELGETHVWNVLKSEGVHEK